jgi:hypothetical protein
MKLTVDNGTGRIRTMSDPMLPGFKAPKKRRLARPRAPEVEPVQVPTVEDRTFQGDLKRGQSTELVVAGALDRVGFVTEIPDHDHTPGDIDNQADVLVNGKVILEVKGRRFYFRGPWDYPFPTAFVGSVDRWNRRSLAPDAVVLVSERTGAKIGIWVDAMDDWMIEKRWDPYRKKQEKSYAVPRDLLVKWSHFVDQLRERV